MPKRVLFTATLVRGHIAKFHIPYLKWFKEQGWETWVAAKNDYPDGVCEIPYCDHYVDIDFARSPFSGKTLVAYRQLRALIRSRHFDIIHTHTPVGSVLTRMAANTARKRGTRVIYTAHGFHFYKGAPLINWLLWYPVECIMSKRTDTLITINAEDFKRAKQFASCDVRYLPGVGIDIEAIKERSRPTEGECSRSQGKNQLIAVGDLIKRKNHAVILQAMALLDDSYELLVCGDGAEENSLNKLAVELGIQRRVKFLGFRNDIPLLLSGSDLMVFPSIHEGLPVSVLEAMACGTPVLATPIRGITPDLIENNVTGYLIGSLRPCDLSEQISSIIEDRKNRDKVAQEAAIFVQRYDVKNVLREIAAIYAI